MADALLASCDDLTGQRVVELSVEEAPTPTLTEPVTAADCANLGKAIIATEMTDNAIEMCGYQPLLDADAPSACGAGFTTRPCGRRTSRTGSPAGAPTRRSSTTDGIAAPWEATTDAPGNHPGGVAYGPMPDLGNCSEDAGDFSSRDSIVSPAVTVPATGQNPLLAFDHYVATELVYDGVSVAYSRNGGAFAAVPASAYVFNAPTEDELPARPGQRAEHQPARRLAGVDRYRRGPEQGHLGSDPGLADRSGRRRRSTV